MSHQRQQLMELKMPFYHTDFFEVLKHLTWPFCSKTCSSLHLFWANQPSLKAPKKNLRGFFNFFWCQRAPCESFLHLYLMIAWLGGCSESKRIWLEPSGHENSTMFVNKMATENIWALLKKSVGWYRRLCTIRHTVSVNKTAMWNVWWHHFLQPGALSGGGGQETVAHIWPQVVGLQHVRNFLYKNDGFLTALWHIYGSHSSKFSYCWPEIRYTESV
jgi:hypothetical protein